MSAEIERLAELAAEVERQLRNDSSLDPMITLSDDKWLEIVAALTERREPREGWNEAIEEAAKVCDGECAERQRRADSGDPNYGDSIIQSHKSVTANKLANLIRALQTSPSPSREAVFVPGESPAWYTDAVANSRALLARPNTALKSPEPDPGKIIGKIDDMYVYEPEPSNAAPQDRVAGDDRQSLSSGATSRSTPSGESPAAAAPAPEMGEYVRVPIQLASDLCSYGRIKSVEAVIYQSGTHLECVKALEDILLSLAAEKQGKEGK